ncbi:phosphate ABC transporter substrate-binding protein [Pseudobutyrivibrio xylanivorans]|uniref:Phosphate-binding protein n=1 Tax=Pseudobutyrivibrio xylanivorans TaxID=185007 RepID=A0A1G5S0X5_PSEXY|nr:phosphate ABC transporter substrate-binding protein [Pseudobutyrivibrio xylanivorans]SCZ79219.1 phosphate transport system substrate-binding protein [Pseudobutyrivibrio xylanivorans]
MKRRIIAIMAAVSIMTFGLVGCGSESPQSADAAEQGKNVESVELNGTIKLAGSTSMEKLCEAMAESFMERNPGVTVTVEYTGSGAGLESLAAGSVDIGNASRGLKDEEKASGAVENIVAIDGIAVITNKSCSIKDVTSKNLAKIYSGEITDWAELGGKEQPIIVIGREAGSGTRDAFEELLEVKDGCVYAQELDSTGAVLAKVATTPGAIGYVSLDVVDDTVSGLKIDGVEPTEEEILAGNYMLQRPFVMATKGEMSGQNELVQAWFNYINSDDGKEVIKQVGLIIPQ